MSQVRAKNAPQQMTQLFIPINLAHAPHVAKTQWAQPFVAAHRATKSHVTQTPLAIQFVNKYSARIIQNSDAVFRLCRFDQHACCGFLRLLLFFVLLKLNLGAPVILHLIHQPPPKYQTNFSQISV